MRIKNLYAGFILLTLCTCLSGCSDSPHKLLEKKCAGAKAQATENAGGNEMAAAMVGGLIQGICDKAIAACKADPKSSDCQDAIQVLSSAPG